MDEQLLEIISILKSNGFLGKLEANKIQVKLIAYTEQFNHLLNLIKLWAKDKPLSCVVKTNELEESENAWQYQEGQEYTCVFEFYPAEKWKINIVIV